jgi:hypothetical protein
MTKLKYHGRGVVLPVYELKDIARRVLTKQGVSHIVDFGAGTLFWSEYFADELGLTVTAVDTFFEKNPPSGCSERISIHTDITEVLDEMSKGDESGDSDKPERPKRAIFICDVIHHLPPALWARILPQITTLFDVVLIKDIDCNRAFGNFCNKMHDRIINGEKIHDVCPREIERELKKAGFATKSMALSKLWYPHFVAAGVKGVKK